MSSQIRNLEPQALWGYFSDLNAVPRPSKQEQRVIAFMQSFGKGLDLPVHTDEVGNVLITKPATPGREEDPVVALQSHLDMVHQKNAGTDFDFASEGIRMLLEGDWIRAEGTTLGADNGIGVAAMMALLASSDISHPPLEALFTIDEETGMTGAKGLQGGLLKAEILLNLDTEEDRELTIGCAGGVDVLASCKYDSHTPVGLSFFCVSLQGLSGGHSGMEIHLGRGNANKLLNRFLLEASKRFGARLHSLDGGGLRNAIPREAKAILGVPEGVVTDFLGYVPEIEVVLQKEYSTTDPDLTLRAERIAEPASVVDEAFQGQFLKAIYATSNGIYRMSPDVAGLVQTSNNLARVHLQAGELKIQCLTRGSLDSEKMDQARAIVCALELMGCEVTLKGEYPGWVPRPQAGIVKLMRETYLELFGSEATVTACHAGLECGILGKNYPEVEMISFGPNIRGAHSPDERVQVSSVQKFWNFLTTTLSRITAVREPATGRSGR